MASSSELSGQQLPRRPTDDYGDTPASLEPPPSSTHATSPGRRPSRGAGGDASKPSQLELGDDIPLLDARCGITRTDLWIAVTASSAIAVIVSELLRALGLR